MDMLTITVLAESQPRRAVMFTGHGRIVTCAVECAQCSLAWVENPLISPSNAARVLADTELVCTSDRKTCSSCHCELEFD